MDPRIEQLIIAGWLHENMRAAADARHARAAAAESRRPAERATGRRRSRSALMVPRRAR